MLKYLIYEIWNYFNKILSTLKFGICFNPFPHIDAFWHLELQKIAFWKHGNKKRNCSKQAISPFVTMFSNLFNYCTFIWSELINFFGSVFKVVSCRFFVCGKGFSKQLNQLFKLSNNTGYLQRLFSNFQPWSLTLASKQTVKPAFQVIEQYWLSTKALF